MKATEHQIQSAFVQWVTLQEKQTPELALSFAVPNAAKRGPQLAAMMKAEGMRAGVPDWMLPCARGTFIGLAIEFKRPDTGRTSKAQEAYQIALRGAGWLVATCTHPEDAIALVRSYLRLPPLPLPISRLT